MSSQFVKAGVWVLTITLTVGFVWAQDGDIVFPDDANVIDVTKSPYMADSTGKADATGPIQDALNAARTFNRIVYLPNGTYVISNTLVWPGSSDEQKRTILQGQSKAHTIIRLKDNCPGYDNATDITKRKTMIYTGNAPAQRFRNAVRNLTIHTGKGNPGATGIQFFGSNQATIRHVKIISGDRSGPAGLDLAFGGQNGPFFVYDLEVDGFDYGILARGMLNSLTLEKITLTNQNNAGIDNRFHSIAIYDLTSINSVPAVRNYQAGATMALVKAHLTGGAPDQPAIINEQTLYARDITTQGYGTAIQNGGGHGNDAAGPIVNEFISTDASTVYAEAAQSSLQLPVEDLPHVPWGPLSEWGNVMDYGAVADGVTDCGPALQKAIDAGHKTVYFPGLTTKQGYALLSDVKIRNNCHRIIGCEAALRNGSGKLIVEDGSSPVVWIERLDFLYSKISIDHNSARTLVISSVTSLPLSVNGPGKVFLADVVGHQFHINNSGAKLWARQLNPENNQGDHVSVKNHGGQLWILGLKTEGKAMDLKVLTDKGGATEILGGVIYNNSRQNNPNAIFKSVCSNLSVAALKYQHFVDPPYHYRWWIEESHGTDTRWLDRSGNTLALYRSAEQTGSAGATCGSGELPPWPAPKDTITCGPLPDLAGFMLNENHDDALQTFSCETRGDPLFCEDAMEGTHSMVFNGSGDWLKIAHPSLTRATGSRSIALWVKAAALSPDTMVLYEEGGHAYGIGLRIAKGELQARVKDDPENKTCDLSIPFPKNQWKHVVLSYGDSSATLYLDGERVAHSDNAPGDVSRRTDGAGIAARHGKDCWGYSNWGHHFKGQLDDVRIWSSALSAQQAAQLFQCGAHTGGACNPQAVNVQADRNAASATGALGRSVAVAVQGRSLAFTTMNAQPCKVTILDPRGRCVARISAGGGEYHLIPLPRSGVYTVVYQNSHGRWTVPAVIIR